jgi:uncharacterized protein YbaP (TraB family)
MSGLAMRGVARRAAVAAGWLAAGLVAVVGLVAPSQAVAQAVPSPAAPPAAACPPVARPPDGQELQAAAAAARDRGLLWRLTRDGRSSYLYGTLHAGRADWVIPGPRVRAALAQTSVLALEIDLTDPATLMKLSRAMALPPDAQPLPADLQQRLQQQLVLACLPEGALAGQRPAAQLMSLSLLDARWVGLDPAFGQDAVLAGVAQARRQPIVALETVAEQMAALLPAQADAERGLVRKALAQLERGLPRKVMARLADAWAAGRLSELAAYESWCACVEDEEDRRWMRRLNDERNPALASRIDRLHRDGRTVFAAVGALHMTGALALPELMARLGYQVERVSLPTP